MNSELISNGSDVSRDFLGIPLVSKITRFSVMRSPQIKSTKLSAL